MLWFDLLATLWFYLFHVTSFENISNRLDVNEIFEIIDTAFVFASDLCAICQFQTEHETNPLRYIQPINWVTLYSHDYRF